jgi:hyperpolarization activated cyclic nucleotide-gated potassium channel 2
MENNIFYNSMFIIHPDNIAKLIFDLLGFALIIFQYVTVPFSIAFNFDDGNLKGYNYFSDIFFIVDMFLNFFTGFYKEGILMMSRKVIVTNYLKGWFLFDFISSFPYSFIFDKLEFEVSVYIL